MLASPLLSSPLLSSPLLSSPLLSSPLLSSPLLSSNILFTSQQDRVHIRCLERDVIYERSRAEELTAELSRCHSDVFTLRERVAAAEQCRRRQQALVEGVSMVTEVNKRYNVKQVCQ